MALHRRAARSPRGREYYYLRARFYDPATGRFLSQDPVPGGNLYSYVGNNPTNWVDRSGMWCPKDPKDCDPTDEIKDAAVGVYNARDDLLGLGVDVACSAPHALVGCGMVGLGPLGDSYFDVNFTACGAALLVSGTFGVQISHGEIHPYFGGGVGWGSGASFNVAPGQQITQGVNCGHAVSIPVSGTPISASGQLGAAPVGDKESVFVEIGVAAGYGYNATCYYVMGDSLVIVDWIFR